MKRLLVALCTLPLFGGITAYAEEDAGPNFSAIEIYMCNYNKGRGAKDLDKVVGKWNKWADESNFTAYNAWTLTPVFNSPDYSFDVGWLGAWKNGADMGEGLQQWKDGGGAMQAEFDKVVSCALHTSFTAVNFKPPVQGDWPAEGVTAFTDCSLEEGARLEDGIKALQGWGGHLAEKGSKAALWMFLPTMGGTADFDYKIVTGHPDFVSLGVDNNDYTNGRGWEKARELSAGKVSCGLPRIYNSVLRRNGGVAPGSGG